MIVPTTRVELERMYVSFYPGGSGTLTQQAIICRLLEEIAEQRGYEIDFLGLLAENNIQVWKNYKNY